MGYGRPLDKFTEKRERGKIQEIALYLDQDEAKFLLRQAEKKIESGTWVLDHLENWDSTERREVKKRAQESVNNWSNVATKITSQLI